MDQIQPPVHVQVNHDLRLLYLIASQVMSKELLSGLLYSDFSGLEFSDIEQEQIELLIIANNEDNN